MKLRRRRVRGTLAVLGFALMLASPDARADAEGAKAAFREGEAAFARKDYVAAARAFERAVDLSPHPAPLLDAAEAWALAGEPDRAAEDCDRVLAMPNVEKSFADAASKRLSRLVPSIATLDIDGARTIVVRIDGGPEASLPAKKRLRAGHHVLAAVDTSSKRAWTLPIDAVAGERTAISIAPPADQATAPTPSASASASPSTAPSAAPPPKTSRRMPTVSYIAFGFAAVSLGVGTVFGFRTLSAKSDFEQSPSLESRDSFYENRAAANVGFAGFGIGLLAGLGAWMLAPASGSE